MIDNLQFAKPEIFLSISAMILLMLGVFRKDKANISKYLFGFTAVILVLTIIQLISLSGFAMGDSVVLVYNRAFIFDNFALLMKLMVCIMSLGVCIIAMSTRYFAGTNYGAFEFPVIMLLSIIGMFILISASDLMSFYIGLELQSLATYILVAINRDSTASTEAGVKYFVLGALASGIILFGASLVYGFSGAINLGDIAALLKANDSITTIPPGIIFGFVLIMAGIFFKISAVPMHMWAPDVYEGSSKPVLAFIATASKISALAFLLRFVSVFESGAFVPFSKILVIVSAASMVLGSFAALRQSSFKRLLAYSSVANMGYILIAVAIGTEPAIRSAIIYMIVYMVSNIGVIAILSLLKSRENDLDLITDLTGLAKTNPMLSAALAILMFSIAGIPPMSGFFGKFFVFREAVSSGFISLAIIGILMSVVACFYYLRIIKVMYFDEGINDKLIIEYNPAIRLLILVSVIFTLSMILFTGAIVDLASVAASSLY